MSSGLNDPTEVREQYASETNLAARKAIYAGAEGPDAREIAIRAVIATRAERVLEVGGGEGEMAERIVRELGCELAFVDQSERMVEIARSRGLDAQVGVVEDLPFDDGAFECVLAAWMLYHSPDLDRALAELARVVRPGGRLVAVTNGAEHLRELRELTGHPGWSGDGLGFWRETGEDLLRPYFASVERFDADGWVSIPDDDAIWRYLRSMQSFTPPDALPPHELPFRVRRCPTIFVATR